MANLKNVASLLGKRCTDTPISPLVRESIQTFAKNTLAAKRSRQYLDELQVSMNEDMAVDEVEAEEGANVALVSEIPQKCQLTLK